MASKAKKSIVVRLVAKDEKGKITYAYHTTKNPQNIKEKLELKKYNPVTRTTEKFIETKIKKAS